MTRIGPIALAVTALFVQAAAAASDGPAPVAADEVVARASRLQGRAFLGRRQGVVGASVVAVPADDPARIHVTSTDTRGGFRFDGLPDGDYVVTVRRDGLRPVRKDGIRVRYPFRAVVELPMEPDAATATATDDGGGSSPSTGAARVALGARVLDEDARPVGDAVLRLVKLDAGADPRVARSDQAGRLGVDGLPAGAWELEVRGVGYLPIRTPVELRGPSTLRVVLMRQPADYVPPPLELMPSEEPLPPASLATAQSPERRTAK